MIAKESLRPLNSHARAFRIPSWGNPHSGLSASPTCISSSMMRKITVSLLTDTTGLASDYYACISGTSGLSLRISTCRINQVRRSYFRPALHLMLDVRTAGTGYRLLIPGQIGQMACYASPAERYVGSEAMILDRGQIDRDHKVCSPLPFRILRGRLEAFSLVKIVPAS